MRHYQLMVLSLCPYYGTRSIPALRLLHVELGSTFSLNHERVTQTTVHVYYAPPNRVTYRRDKTHPPLVADARGGWGPSR